VIELPEAVTIAKQLTAALKGKRVESAMRGNAPHKFAFYTRSPEEYASIVPGKTIGKAADWGSCILVAVEPDHFIELGGGGERIAFHQSEATVPKRHQLLLRFTDGTCLSVTVQGWGSCKLLQASEVGPRRLSPLDATFTAKHLAAQFAELDESDSRSIKFFVISQPGVWGVGNGYLHDILFRCGIHPRRRAVQTTDAERAALYDAIRTTIATATDAGGRDTERNVHGEHGAYVPLLDRRAKGCPCPHCGTPIEAISFLGGKSYLCPTCQT